jgi:hypothetical protein
MKKKLHLLLLCIFCTLKCFSQEDLFLGTWTDSFKVRIDAEITYNFNLVVEIRESSKKERIGEVDIIANKKCHKKWKFTWGYPDPSLNQIIEVNFKRPDTTECDKKNMSNGIYSHDAYMQIINANYFVHFENTYGNEGKRMYMTVSENKINELRLVGLDKKEYATFYRVNKKKNNSIKTKNNTIEGWWTIETTLSNQNGVYATSWGCVGFLENGRAELSDVGKGIQGCVPALKNHKFSWWFDKGYHFQDAPNSLNHPITWLSENQFKVSDASSINKIFTRSNSEYDAKSWYNSWCQVNCPEAQIINNKQTPPKIKNQEGASNGKNTCVNCNGTRKATCSACSGTSTAISYKWETRIVTEYDAISGQTITREAREYLPSNSKCTRCSGSGRDPHLTCPACN